MTIFERVKEAKANPALIPKANKSIMLLIKRKLGGKAKVTQISKRKLQIEQTWIWHFKYGDLKYSITEKISFRTDLLFDLNKSDASVTILDWIEATLSSYKSRIKDIKALETELNKNIRAEYYKDNFILEISYQDKISHVINGVTGNYGDNCSALISEAIAEDKAKSEQKKQQMIQQSLLTKHSGAAELVEELILKYSGSFTYSISAPFIHIYADGIEIYSEEVSGEDFVFYSLTERFNLIAQKYEQLKITKAKVYELANAVNAAPNDIWICHVFYKQSIFVELSTTLHPKIKSLIKIQIGDDVRHEYLNGMFQLLDKLRCRGFYYYFTREEANMNDG